MLGAVSYLGLTTLLTPRDALLVMNVVPAAVALA